MRAGILCAHAWDNPVSRSIQWLTEHWGEGRSWSDHNGDWFELGEGEEHRFPPGLLRGHPGGLTLVGPCEFVIESTMPRTRLLLDWEARYSRPRSHAIVLVPRGTTDAHARSVLTHAESYIGRDYDLFSIARNFGDGLIGKLAHRDVYLFRRIRFPWNRAGRYNICTWLTAWTWRLGRKWKFHGRVRVNSVEWRGTRPRLRKITTGWAEVAVEHLTPDHVMDDAFERAPGEYAVVREVGGRHPELPAAIAAKIDADLAARPFRR